MKSKKIFAVLLILLFWFTFWSTVVLYAPKAHSSGRCDAFATRAYDEQWQWQNSGTRTDWEPSNKMEHAMKTEVVWQWKRHSKQNQLRVVSMFAQDWKESCLIGQYNE